MTVRPGQIVVNDGVTVFSRIQSGGPSDVNRNPQKVYELGNHIGVGTVYDIPDVQVPYTSWDVTCELVALLTGKDPVSDNVFDLGACKPVDLIPHVKLAKTSANRYNVAAGSALPFLSPTRVTFRGSVDDMASTEVQFQGDSVYYGEFPFRIHREDGTNTADQVVALDYDAATFEAAGGNKLVLSVTIVGDTTERLTEGVDFSVAGGVEVGGFTPDVEVTVFQAVPTSSHIRIVYGSDEPLQILQSAHPTPPGRPAALRGQDLLVYITPQGGYDPTDPDANAPYLWSQVQSYEVAWSIPLESTKELGNPNIVARDYDVAEVSGSVTSKFKNPARMLERIRQIAGVTDETRIIGPTDPVSLEMNIVYRHPVNGTPLLRIRVPDAQFVLPGMPAQVQQDVDQTMTFSSDAGELYAYNDAYLTTVELESDTNPATQTDDVEFTATVSAVHSLSGTPAGTVQFYDGTSTLGSPVALTAGVATYSTDALPVGTRSITAVFIPSGNWVTATSAAVSQVITA